MLMEKTIKPMPLSHKKFAPFGDVIEKNNACSFLINEGNAMRFNDLAKVDVEYLDGQASINIFCAQATSFPLHLKILERHRLGSQAFYPLQNHPYLVVVANSMRGTSISGIKIFKAKGTQGVNYHRGVWHHPLIALQPNSDFIVIDRRGDQNDTETIVLKPPHDRYIIKL